MLLGSALSRMMAVFREGSLVIMDDNGTRLVRECWIAFASVLSRMIVFGRWIALVVSIIMDDNSVMAALKGKDSF